MSALTTAVCVLLRGPGGRFLFIERAPGRVAAGYWTPITGRLEPGEALESAARREVLEEVGLTAKIGRELGRTGTEAPGGGSAGFELVWFEAETEGSVALTLQEDEVAHARWVTIAEALELAPMFPTTRRFLAAL
jgi:8-oxo-dGTP pyrophosphatase MutT (NUDIX family)